MNHRLELSLLGGLEIRWGGQPITGLASRKAEALIVYLACSRRVLPRTEMATLLWDDRTESAALGNLRVLLTSLRQAIGACLTITRDSVQLSEGTVWVDALEMERQIAAVRETTTASGPLSSIEAAQLASAMALYRGDFLQGFFLRDAFGFEEWAVVERERLRQLLIIAHHDLVDFYLNTGEYQSGINSAARLLALDPLRESAHRQMMMLLARNGQTAAALSQYEACARILAAELSIEPDPDTQALYARLKEAGSSYRHNLPSQTTPFIGRDHDMEEVDRQLADPETRLITLVGPGGIGKTRLALQVASAKVGAFLHGVWHVPLAALAPGADEAGLASAIAEALNFAASGRGDIQSQLLAYLSEKELLLVADNFEHLLAASDLLAKIIARCPQVKVLVTSRERLNLVGEWVVDLGGLGLPPADETDNPESYDALRLFIQTARRASGRFKPAAADIPAMIQICRLVGGMPLAIELAAGWARTLSVQEIAAEIERDMNFLAASTRGMAERHQSMAAVFQHSWQLLSPEEQTAFSRLSVFHGGFQREAAVQIAHASVPAISGLVDKSLLRHEAGARFVMHPVLHQFAEDEFANSVLEQTETRAHHARYYLHWLGTQSANLNGTEQRQTLEVVATEINNIRAAFNTALKQTLEIVESALEGLYLFYEMRGHYGEAGRIFAELESALRGSGNTRLWALSLARHGWFQYRLSRYTGAEAAFKQSLELLQSVHDTANESFACAGLGYTAIARGDYTTAHTLLERSLSIARANNDSSGIGRALTGLGAEANAMGRFAEAREFHAEALFVHQTQGDQHRIAISYNNLGSVTRALGDYENSKRFYELGLAIRRQLKDLRGIALTINNLANVYGEQGDYASARSLHEEGLAIHTEIGDVWGRALSLHNLGDASQLMGAYNDARSYFHRSLEARRRIGDRRGMAYTLLGLGQTEIASGGRLEARRFFKEAIQITLELKLAPLMLESILRTAQLLAADEQTDLAYRFSAYVAAQSATEKRVRAQAEELCTTLQQPLGLELPGNLAALTLAAMAAEAIAALSPENLS